MAFKYFGLLILLRLIVLCLGISGFYYAYNNPRYHVVTFIAFLIVISLIYELWFFLTRTNREVARFLASLRYTDFNQSFDYENVGAGFQPLGDAFTRILEQFKKLRITQESEVGHLRAVINHIPVPLMTVKQDGSLLLINNAARRFFGTPQPTKYTDLKRYGTGFYEHIINCRAGEKTVSKIYVDGIDTQVSLGLMEVTGNTGTEKLFSIQDIGQELESTQLTAWQDLVRVLTHEIMNSITPVASLAQTTADIAGDLKNGLPTDHSQKENIEKIVNASMTMSRRAGNLMDFVANFRKLTRLPKPNKQVTKVKDLFAHVMQITEANNLNSRIRLVTEVNPDGLELYIDQEQIEQALINLLKNAEQAMNETREPAIKLMAGLNQRGGITIEVNDNGTGIKEDIINKIFVPYFTTKPDGSGIGLALTRQIMANHGGFVSAANLEEGGASFRLTF
ncbi:MAG: PAS domain-containing protein [Deltaproteobacteria bacterium]|nr:PAS domain-containing protein [Deltaproteobacteria bacterium]